MLENADLFQMDVMEVNENKCLICLEDYVELSWNDLLPANSILTYKDCYFKYTQLKHLDEDNFPNMICRYCSDGLEYIDAFISRAIETNAKLQEMYKLNIANEKEKIRSKFEKIYLEIEIRQESENSIINGDSIKDCLTLPEESQRVYRLEMCKSISQSSTEQHRGPGEIENNQFINKSQDEKPHNICNKKSKAEIVKPKNKSKEISLKENLTEKETLQKSFNVKKPKYTSTVINENICEQSELTLDNSIESKFLAKTEKRSLAIANKTKINKTVKRAHYYWQNNRPFLCQYCPLEVKGLTSIRRHEATHNEKRKRTETCPKCGVKFFTKGSLRVHMNTHDENRQKQFKCEFCDKAFFNRGALNVHRRIHLGLMIKCQICSKEYYRKTELYKHMNTHSSTIISVEAKKMPRYMVRCKYCNKEILSRSFKSHTAAHLNQPLMKCSICNKEYFNRGSCRAHIQTIHKKTSEEINDYIISYEKNRLLHLYLRQKTDLQLNEED